MTTDRERAIRLLDEGLFLWVCPAHGVAVDTEEGFEENEAALRQLADDLGGDPADAMALFKDILSKAPLECPQCESEKAKA